MIALYKGISSKSWLIRWQTWREYSHASWVFDDGREIESYGFRGVHVNDRLGEGHTPGTKIDLFTLPGLADMQRMELQGFLEDQIGKGYDWLGVLRFVTRTRPRRPTDSRWFCSELIAAACGAAGHPLFRDVPPRKISPGKISDSPRIAHWKTIELGKDELCF